ncbi:MAG: hypothetical protein BRD50_01200 [Bacteroidetes bacterium SW_11_45_7]|nr:MAG: hypothetical protein BRD50_01200 [Bacteroidetes bacterium SW_11_45_7]
MAPPLVEQSGKQGYKSLRHHQITPLVVGAVQKQQKQHLSQKDKIEALQAENNTLQQRVQKQENQLETQKQQIRELKQAVQALQKDEDGQMQAQH